MIIDFRLRPPVGNYPNMPMFTNLARNATIAKGCDMTQAPSVTHASMELCLSEMEEAGISIGVASGRASNAAYGDISNDDLVDIATGYDGKFVCFAGVNPAKPDEAIAQIDKYILNGPLMGINIEPGVLPIPLYCDDRRLYPVYEYCQDKGVRVMIMCGGGAGPDVSYTDPVHVDHVAAEFPKMTIIASHGGWPWASQILSVAYRRPNLWVSPDMYMFSFPGWQDYVTAANGFLQDRFLYGSSYPFLPIVDCARRYPTLPFKREVLPKLMYHNAARLLNIE